MKDLSVSQSALIEAAEVLLRLARTKPQPPSIPQLDSFITKHCHDSPGSLIRFREFFDLFYATLSDLDRDRWPHQRWKLEVIAALRHPYGKHNHNQRFIGNISWERPKRKPTRQFVAVKGRLKLMHLATT